MFSELIAWFTGRPENRRRYPRRAGPFRAWVADGTSWTAVTCVDLSAGGLGLISPMQFDKPESNLRVALEGKAMLLRAKPMWCIPGTLSGKPVWRYGMQFTGIAADDWDGLVRFCNNESLTVENQAQKELQAVRMQADDVARLIPKRLQDRLLKMLVAEHRLAKLEDDKIPLVQYSYGGAVKRGDRLMHRLVIHSRVRDPVTEESVSYDTHFIFDDAGNDVEIERR